MKTVWILLITLLLLLFPCAGSAGTAGSAGRAWAAESPITAKEMEGHIRFLSDDLLEGRAVGSRGIALAALYHESCFRSFGLKPLFGESWRQTFLLEGSTPDTAAGLALAKDAERVSLTREEEFVVNSPRADCPEAVSGDLVYCGYLIEAPEWQWDDLKATDVRGKVLVVEVNEPENRQGGLFDGEDMTWYGRWVCKFEKAAELGALGILLLHDTKGAGYGWDVVRNSWGGEELRLAEKKSPLAFQGWLHASAAQRLFALAGLRREAMRALAETREFRPVPLGVSVEVRQRPTRRTVEAQNVGGLLEGVRRDRFLVVCAHFDHMGKDARAKGDGIYNGAVDNCSASAAMLALARWYGSRSERPPVSLVFLAASAEEHGLLGSDYFARHMPFPRESTVAAINFEMTNVWGRTRDVYALGARYSELDDYCAKAASRLGLEYVAEQGGKVGFFFRSDQLSFARAGVPAVWLHEGLVSTTGVAQKRSEYQRARYHKTSDEMGSDWDLDGAVQMTEWAQELIGLLSQAKEMPRFRKESPFQR